MSDYKCGEPFESRKPTRAEPDAVRAAAERKACEKLLILSLEGRKPVLDYLMMLRTTPPASRDVVEVPRELLLMIIEDLLTLAEYERKDDQINAKETETLIATIRAILAGDAAKQA